MTNRTNLANNLENESDDSDEIAVSHLLEDWLNGVEPADFKAKILHRLQENGADNPDHIAARAFADQQISQGYGIVIPPPVVTLKSTDEQLGVWIQRGATLVAVLAACVLAVLLVPAALRSQDGTAKNGGNGLPLAGGQSKVQDDKKENIAINEPGKESNLRRLPSLATNSEQQDLNERKSGQEKANSSLASNDNPSTPTTALGTPSTETKTVETSTPARPKRDRLVGAMADREIVGVVDNQLKHLWDSVGIAPESSIKWDAWLERASWAIVGRMPTAAERETFRTNKNDDKQIDFVNRLIDSEEFARHWSKILAEHYLGRPIAPARQNESDEQAFVQWIESSLLRKRSLGELESDMVATPAEGMVSPSSYWLAEMIESSENIYRDTSRHLSSPGKAQDAKDAGLIGAARQLMRISGNNSMACTQCHGDLGVGSMELASDAKTLLTSNELFWRVPANFAGMSIKYENKLRQWKSSGRPEFFFEDADGRMQLVQPSPPSSIAENQAKSLADWLRTSSEPRRAVVELVWNKMLSQPLVPVFGLSGSEGQLERNDLRDLLAMQLQRNGGELGGLVRWIVLSKPFQLDRISVESPWYLKATEVQLANKQNQLRLFSGFTANQAAVAGSGPSMDLIVGWVDSNSSFQKSDSALAQGNGRPSTSVVPPNKSSKSEYSEQQIRYLMSVSKPYEQLAAISSRWGKSSMDWASKVDHAYLLANARYPNRKEREDADRLLEAALSDHPKAMVMLMNANLGSW